MTFKPLTLQVAKLFFPFLIFVLAISFLFFVPMVHVAPSDLTPPVLSSTDPSGTLPSGITEVNLTLDTDEGATCKYDTSPGIAYASMSNTFTSTGGTSHSADVTGLSDGNSYTYYVRCIDIFANANLDDEIISFSIEETPPPPEPHLPPPVLSNTDPSGTLPSGITEVTLTLDTDEDATCKYDTSPGIAYASMSNTFTSTGGTSHSVEVTGLSDGNSYTYYVRCIDIFANANLDDEIISFSVHAPVPADITDLVSETIGTTFVTLGWTATGDDGTSGQASSYDLRYSTSPITLGNWDSATVVTGLQSPDIAGAHETFTVVGLLKDTSYWFAVRATGQSSNESGLSNVVNVTTLESRSGSVLLPPAIPSPATATPLDGQVRLTWTNPTVDFVRTVVIRKLGSPPAFREDGIIVYEGVEESFVDSGLTNGMTHYYGIYTFSPYQMYSDLVQLSAIPMEGEAQDVSTPQVELTYDPVAARDETQTINEDRGLSDADPSEMFCESESLIKIPDDGDPETHHDETVYYCGSDGTRYTFPNEKVFKSWYPDFSSVVILPNEVMSQIPLDGNVTYKPGVRMVKTPSLPEVYAVARGGILRWVTSELVAERLYGLLWNTFIDDISPAFFTDYAIGEPIE